MPTPQEIIEEFTARRSVNLERRLEDEAAAVQEIEKTIAAFGCGLQPELNEKGAYIGMRATTYEADSPETQQKIIAFAEHIQKIKQEYQIEFFPVQVEKADGTIELQQVVPMVIW